MLPLQNKPLGWPDKVGSAVSHCEVPQADCLIDIEIVKGGQFDMFN